MDYNIDAVMVVASQEWARDLEGGNETKHFQVIACGPPLSS